MSTKNQNRKDDKDDVTEPPSTEQQFQREQQQAVNKVSHETRYNIKKTTNEARKEILNFWENHFKVSKIGNFNEKYRKQFNLMGM